MVEGGLLEVTFLRKKSADTFPYEGHFFPFCFGVSRSCSGPHNLLSRVNYPGVPLRYKMCLDKNCSCMLECFVSWTAG